MPLPFGIVRSAKIAQLTSPMFSFFLPQDIWKATNAAFNVTHLMVLHPPMISSFIVASVAFARSVDFGEMCGGLDVFVPVPKIGGAELASFASVQFLSPAFYGKRVGANAFSHVIFAMQSQFLVISSFEIASAAFTKLIGICKMGVAAQVISPLHVDAGAILAGFTSV